MPVNVAAASIPLDMAHGTDGPLAQDINNTFFGLVLTSRPCM
jgi:hypothetical protein